MRAAASRRPTPLRNSERRGRRTVPPARVNGISWDLRGWLERALSRRPEMIANRAVLHLVARLRPDAYLGGADTL